jgi:hypothetical protein
MEASYAPDLCLREGVRIDLMVKVKHVAHVVIADAAGGKEAQDRGAGGGAVGH